MVKGLQGMSGVWDFRALAILVMGSVLMRGGVEFEGFWA